MLRKSFCVLLMLLYGLALSIPAGAGQAPSGAFESPPELVSQSSPTAAPGMSFEVGEIPLPCPAAFVAPATEGPYYKTGSPERRNLLTEGIPGEPITVTGYVFDRNCRPIPGAWIDFWQTDGDGRYDNRGFRLRGHQYTDRDGKYLLRTVFPGEYPGRTNHIHVKVRAHEGAATVTSQLYFQGSALNESDFIFNPAMLTTITTGKNGEKIAFFNFRLNR